MDKNTYSTTYTYDHRDVLYAHSIQCTRIAGIDIYRYLISPSVPIPAASAGPLGVGAVAAEVAVPVATLQGQWELIGRFPGLDSMAPVVQ